MSPIVEAGLSSRINQMDDLTRGFTERSIIRLSKNVEVSKLEKSPQVIIDNCNIALSQAIIIRGYRELNEDLRKIAVGLIPGNWRDFRKQQKESDSVASCFGIKVEYRPQRSVLVLDPKETGNNNNVLLYDYDFFNQKDQHRMAIVSSITLDIAVATIAIINKETLKNIRECGFVFGFVKSQLLNNKIELKTEPNDINYTSGIFLPGIENTNMYVAPGYLYAFTAYELNTNGYLKNHINSSKPVGIFFDPEGMLINTSDKTSNI